MSKASMIGLILLGIWLVLVNLAAYLLYTSDKNRAIKGAWRIPEKTLIGISFLGGGVGALVGMIHLHHKTRHLRFWVLVPLGLVFSLLVAGLIVWLLLR